MLPRLSKFQEECIKRKFQHDWEMAQLWWKYQGKRIQDICKKHIEAINRQQKILKRL